MRLFVTLLALLSVGALVQAQITIERQDFTLEPGARVTFWHLDHTNASPPEPGEGVIWDFSELLLDDGFYTDYEIADSEEFPGSNLEEPSIRPILGGLASQGGTYYSLLDDTGYSRLGNISESVNVGLGTFTNAPGDTLKVLSKVYDFTEPETLIRFPLNFGDSWGYDNTTTTDFNVTVAAFGLQDTPASQVSRDSVNLSVVGYGTLILPNPSGIGTVSIEALMIERNRHLAYNYFLGGQPAPQLMLDLFGLQQGRTENITRYFFYAKGLPRSAANIRLDQNGNIILFTIPDDLQDVISSSKAQAAEPVAIQAFPSPIRTGELLSVHLPFDVFNGAFELFDAYGRQAAAWPVDAAQGQMLQYALPGHVPAGLYVFRIIDENKQVRGIGKLNVVK